MYAVTPTVESAWRELLRRSPPKPAWRWITSPTLRRSRSTAVGAAPSGAVFMCGYPVALGLAPVIPLAAPIPSAPWAGGQAVYRTDLIVRTDAPYRPLADTCGGRAGWTVSHSQSGFNAFRHELLPYRTPARPWLYRHMQGELVTARNVLDAVRDGRIDVGPLDAYWHLLIARHAPELTQGVRVLTSTPLTPIPAFVAAAAAPAELVQRLQAAFVMAAERPWFAALAQAAARGIRRRRCRSLTTLLRYQEARAGATRHLRQRLL
jgi:ABC-type phosphate/phosphonate transport system substrate-binding protein